MERPGKRGITFPSLTAMLTAHAAQIRAQIERLEKYGKSTDLNPGRRQILEARKTVFEDLLTETVNMIQIASKQDHLQRSQGTRRAYEILKRVPTSKEFQILKRNNLLHLLP